MWRGLQKDLYLKGKKFLFYNKENIYDIYTIPPWRILYISKDGIENIPDFN